MKESIKKILIFGIALIMCFGIFTACETDYGYEFHFVMVGANGSISAEGGWVTVGATIRNI